MDNLASIIIPTYQREEQLRATLVSLRYQNCTGEFEVVIVDDGSLIDTKAIVDEFATDFPVQWHWQRHDGFRAAKARNTGILFSNGSIIIFLDDDMLVDSDFVSAHLHFHTQNPETAGIGFRNRVTYRVWSQNPSLTPGDLRHLAVRDPRLITLQTEGWKRFPWAFFATCNASVPKDALLAAGLFDESFNRWGFEDSELSYRLNTIGLDFAPVFAAIGYHLDPDSSDLTILESPYDLPEEKLEDYWEGSYYFANKYADDLDLQFFLEKDRFMRLLVRKGYLPGVKVEAMDDFTKQPFRTQRTANEINHLIQSTRFSLLSEYDEQDEFLADYTTALRIAHREQMAHAKASLLERVAIPLDKFWKRIRSFFAPVVTWLQIALITPFLLAICLVILGLMVITGRYQRLFRRAP